MITSEVEYQKMYGVEDKLWWYRILHNKVFEQIKYHFPTDTSNLNILDAACGTGGLIRFLNKKGITQISGFDYASFAVSICIKDALNVSFGDLKKISDYGDNKKYDVICCMDAFYFLSDNEIEIALKEFQNRLTPKGIIIINIHAFEMFSGTHDLAIGSNRRYQLADFQQYFQKTSLHLQYYSYWPFLLSIPILIVRQLQKLKLRVLKNQSDNIESDVSHPGDLPNRFFYFITNLEEKLFNRGIFGSSLFMVLKTKSS